MSQGGSHASVEGLRLPNLGDLSGVDREKCRGRVSSLPEGGGNGPPNPVTTVVGVVFPGENLLARCCYRRVPAPNVAVLPAKETTNQGVNQDEQHCQNREHEQHDHEGDDDSHEGH